MLRKRPGPPPEPTFWEEECPDRGAALKHAHWEKCNPAGVHPGTDERHDYAQCCHCGYTAETWKQRHLVAEVLEIDEGKPLELEQPFSFGRCSIPHTSAKELVGDDGLEWEKCRFCGVPMEPKMSPAGLLGPSYGIGRGWVSPRTRRRWEFIARQAMRDDESNLRQQS